MTIPAHLTPAAIKAPQLYVIPIGLAGQSASQPELGTRTMDLIQPAMQTSGSLATGNIRPVKPTAPACNKN